MELLQGGQPSNPKEFSQLVDNTGSSICNNKGGSTTAFGGGSGTELG